MIRSRFSCYLCITIFSLLLCISLVSCKKGDTGAPGQKGDKGDSAIANVFYSDWQSASTVAKDSTMDASNVKVIHLLAPRITEEILTHGAILVYFTYGSGTFSLPYTGNAGGKPSTIGFSPGLGQLLIYRFTHDNSASIGIGSNNQYRYIIVPGGVKVQNANRLKTGTATDVALPSIEELKAMSYEEACQKLSVLP